MKLFGGKKGDEKAAAQGDDEAGYYDSPQETVSLSGPRNPPQSGAKPVAGAPAAAAAAAPARVIVEDEEPPRPSYGINQAIELMRLLPVDQNPELVVQVIKGTLESMKVKVSEIIADADRKTKDLEERVGNLKRAIGDFEKEIETRKEEIGRLEADHKETTGVRARLELAERAQRAQPAPVKAKTG
jgi:hypothetical protein